MAIDQNYIAAFSIETVILDRDDGAPLSGGLVYFEKDNQRGILKPVYQITGTSPNYTYTQLPNPMVLSSIGTFEDALGNPVIPYFYPYDSSGALDLYYIRVTSALGVEQFDREAVPYVIPQEGGELVSLITNELSNPQFVDVNFDTTSGAYVYSLGTVVNEVINIAPDWDLIVSCPVSGTVTVTQTLPSGALNILSNPSAILTIASAGLTKLQLRQRIFGSPNLWGSGYISGTFVAKTYSGSPVTLNMLYSQSNGLVVDELLVSASLDSTGNYEEFSNSILIPASTSSQTFPTAYIDIYFDIPLSIQIDITSIMIAFTGSANIASIGYDQESYARQIDHLYHYAYPIVPVGSIIDFGGFDVPLHYYLCDGTAYNRISNYKLFKSLTKTDTVTLTTGLATFTVVSNANYHIGMKLEGTGIPAGVSVSTIVGTTITMSAVATESGSKVITLFAWGNGDGNVSLTPTTFNVPDLRGYATAGADGSLFYTTAPGDLVNGVGASGGESKHVLTVAEMPAHNHDLGSGYGGLTNIALGRPQDPGAGAGLINSGSNAWPVIVNTQGGSEPHSLVQPTVLVKKCIRYQ